MPQAPQFQRIIVPLGGIPAPGIDFKFYGRNVRLVTFLFVPDTDDQCITLTNSGVYVQPLESGTKQLLLNNTPHQVRFAEDNSPPQMNTGEEGFAILADTDNLSGTLFYWIDHILGSVAMTNCGCGNDCDDETPCAGIDVAADFKDDFMSVLVDVAASRVHSDEHWATENSGGGFIAAEERDGGWIFAEASSTPDLGRMIGLQGTFWPNAAPARPMRMKGSVFVEFTPLSPIGSPLDTEVTWGWETPLTQGAPPRRILFFARWDGVTQTWGNWQAHLFGEGGAPDVTVDTGVPVGIDCPNSQELEIIIQNGQIVYYIDDAVVATIPLAGITSLSTFAPMLQAEIAASDTSIEGLELHCDYFCGQTGRSCVVFTF